MSRRLRHALLLLLVPAAVVLAVAAVPASAFAQDDEGESEESGGIPGDHPYRPNLREGGALAEFHPTYKLTHTRDRDISAWNHDFSFTYPVSSRISFAASSGIDIRENTALDRVNRQENWNASLKVALSSALSTGIKFTRSRQADVRNEGQANEVRSSREKDVVDLSTSYSKTFLNGVGLSLGATGGLEKNDYADIRSKGSRQSINASMSYDAPLGIKTRFGYSGNHSLLDSEQGALRSTDESIAHNLTAKIDYEVSGSAFAIDLKRSMSENEYPKEQQTEQRSQDSESIGLTADLSLVGNLTSSIGLDYSRNRVLYEIESSRNNDITTRSVNAQLGYSVAGTKLTADLRSEKKRNEYFDFQTGDVFANSVGASAAREFGDRVSAALRAKMSLLSTHYDDVGANDQDRDLFDREASLQIDYEPREDITTGLLLKVREDQLIYIRTSRTGDNKTSQTFSVQPSFTKRFGPRISVSQKYELSADYTFYTYDEDSNFLIRNFVVSTALSWRPTPGIRLSIDHSYRGQDEGSYVEDESGNEVYGKNSERDDHTMSIVAKYRLLDLIDIEVKQQLGIQRRWTFNDGVREFSWEKYDTSISGSAGLDHTLEDGTKLSVSVGRIHRDATNIVDRQRELWDIRLSIDKTF